MHLGLVESHDGFLMAFLSKNIQCTKLYKELGKQGTHCLCTMIAYEFKMKMRPLLHLFFFFAKARDRKSSNLLAGFWDVIIEIYCVAKTALYHTNYWKRKAIWQFKSESLFVYFSEEGISIFFEYYLVHNWELIDELG